MTTRRGLRAEERRCLYPSPRKTFDVLRNHPLSGACTWRGAPCPWGPAAKRPRPIPDPVMSSASIGLSDDLHEYLLSITLRESDAMTRLRRETAEHPKSNMQIAPEQGQFLRFLVQLIGARRTLEIGVFTGYSALAVAEVLPPNGEIVACDVSEEYTQVARRHWTEAGVDDTIDLRLAPAAETLDALLSDGQAGTFDFSFIDADKEAYDTYYEQSLELLRPGGVIALDNMFRGGAVAGPAPDDDSIRATRRLNEKLHADERIELSVLPLADGVTLAMKR